MHSVDYASSSSNQRFCVKLPTISHITINKVLRQTVRHSETFDRLDQLIQESDSMSRRRRADLSIRLRMCGPYRLSSSSVLHELITDSAGTVTVAARITKYSKIDLSMEASIACVEEMDAYKAAAIMPLPQEMMIEASIYQASLVSR